MFKILPAYILVLLSTNLFAQDNIDSTIISSKSATIHNKKFTGFLRNGSFCLLNSAGDTLVKEEDYYIMWEFRDLNKDGYKDVILDLSGNTPSVLDLFIFLPKENRFKKVKDFDHFPAPEQIAGTPYYYSYHKSGCADMNWDSDLFYIKNFKAIRMGNIAGRECNDSDEKNAVYIHKVRGSKKVVFRKLPIEDIYGYKDLKWGFIKAYWTKHFKLFL